MKLLDEARKQLDALDAQMKELGEALHNALAGPGVMVPYRLIDRVTELVRQREELRIQLEAARSCHGCGETSEESKLCCTCAEGYHWGDG
jgi:hypothetical protein